MLTSRNLPSVKTSSAPFWFLAPKNSMIVKRKETTDIYMG